MEEFLSSSDEFEIDRFWSGKGMITETIDGYLKRSKIKLLTSMSSSNRLAKSVSKSFGCNLQVSVCRIDLDES